MNGKIVCFSFNFQRENRCFSFSKGKLGKLVHLQSTPSERSDAELCAT